MVPHCVVPHYTVEWKIPAWWVPQKFIFGASSDLPQWFGLEIVKPVFNTLFSTFERKRSCINVDWCEVRLS